MKTFKMSKMVNRQKFRGKFLILGVQVAVNSPKKAKSNIFGFKASLVLVA